MNQITKLKNVLEYYFPPFSDLRKYAYKYKPYKAKFRSYYLDEGWSVGEGLSGVAASEATKKQLSKLFNRYKILNLIDAPCGDFLWMRDVDLTGINYLGLDIVPELIAANISKYQSKNISFACLDLTSNKLPKADLIFCRDFFVHYSTDFIFRSIRNMKESSSQYLLTTTFTRLQRNAEIKSIGLWRPINLQLPPFNFPAPISIIEEDNQKEKLLGLWKLNDLALSK